MDVRGAARPALVRPRMVGVITGEPFHPATWSRTSRHLFTALDRHGVLVGAVDSRPPSIVTLAAKVSTVSWRRQRWRERYEYAPLRRAAESWLGGRRAMRVDATPDALLQIGAYYDFSGIRGLRPRVRCSYHDANSALFARSGTFIEDAGARHVRALIEVEQRLFDRLDVIFTMSEWLRRSFIDDLGQRPEKVVTVGAGVNSDHLPDEIDRRWDAPHILYVGFDWRRKGGPLLLEAFRRFRRVRPDAQLTVVGPTREDAGEDADGARWLGPIARDTAAGGQLFDLLHREATVFVMPSLFEPFGNAFLEAMAYRLPCIGADRCAMPEIISEGETGLLVRTDDPDELVEHLSFLAQHPERAKAMGSAGAAKVAQRFTWPAVTEQMVRTVQERL